LDHQDSQSDVAQGNAHVRSGSPRKGAGRKTVNGIPVSLVPNTPGGSDETLTAILIETPTPSPQKQKLYKNQANSIIEEDEDEVNSSGSGNESPKDKLVKEGAYLKSRLWWFGLLLIATGEGGESFPIPNKERADKQVTFCLMDLHLQVW